MIVIELFVRTVGALVTMSLTICVHPSSVSWRPKTISGA